MKLNAKSAGSVKGQKPITTTTSPAPTRDLYSTRGFTLVEIMIVVAIIGLLAVIAVPNFVKARTTSQAAACINNLRQMDGAVQQYALENKKSSIDTYTLSALKPYIKLDSTGNLPACPAAGTYSAGASVTNAPTCTVGGHVLP